MRRMNNLVTLFSAMFAFFFGCFLSKTLNNLEKCHVSNFNSQYSNTNDPKNIFLMVLILTAPNYFERREIIRNTWLKYTKPSTPPAQSSSYYPEDFIYIPEYDKDGFLEQDSPTEQSNSLRLYYDWLENQQNDIDIPTNYRTKYFFAIGIKDLNPSILLELRQEQATNNDLLLIENLHDSYANLTSKLLMSIDKLTQTYNYNYILKTDDDTYVKLDLLKNELISYHTKLITKSQQEQYIENPLPELYWGYFNGYANIKTKGQWHETHYNLCQRYGPYALGGGYIISRNIAKYITINSKILNTYISEDVSMGAWLGPLKNIHRRHDVRFDTGYMPRKCKKHHLVLHKRTIKQMKDLYDKKICTFEGDNEKSMKRPLEYYYDWQNTLDKCCITPAKV